MNRDVMARLARAIQSHRHSCVKLLVYHETFGDVNDAIHRETRLKKFTRKRKIELIEDVNPRWLDLAESL